MLCFMIMPFCYDLQFNVNPIRDKRHVFCLLTHVFFLHIVYILPILQGYANF